MNSGSWLPEVDFQGISDDFFDDLNHIDFPLEDGESGNGGGDWDVGFQDLEPPPMDMFSGLSSHFNSGHINNGSGPVGGSKTIPISKQTSSCEGINSSVISKLFQSSSPVSVLENSNRCFYSKTQSLAFPVKGARSKRKRPTPQKLRRLVPFEAVRSQQLISPDESESEIFRLLVNPTKKKCSNHQIQIESVYSDDSSSGANNWQVCIRKCSHCETTRTPQWREGPNGPKTLCNACGVRFRSGRLVPEYRPAASPTFTPSLHSNSHRKIIEMRRKGDEQFDSGTAHIVISRA